MIIRNDQMRALDLAARIADPEPYIDHLKECHASAVDAIGEAQLPAHVTAALTKAYEYGIASTPDYFRFLDLVTVFGLDWTKEELKWMHECMSDPSVSDPSVRLDQLFLRAMYRLEGETGGAE